MNTGVQGYRGAGGEQVASRGTGVHGYRGGISKRGGGGVNDEQGCRGSTMNRGAWVQAVNRCTSFSRKANRPHRATASLRWASRIPSTSTCKPLLLLNIAGYHWTS